MKKLLLTTVCLLIVSSMALGQAKSRTTSKKVHRYGGLSCGSDPILPTDGAATYDYVGLGGAPGGANYYLVHLKDGHSYSAEAYDSTDEVISGTAQLSLIATDCQTALPTTDVVSLDPDLSNDFADRISWIQTGNVDAVLILTNNDSNNFYSYTIRIVDTTLHNPRWSTFSGFITQYALVNNTNTPITGTLTLIDSTGTQYFANVTVPAGGENFQTTSGLSVPGNHFGFANFTFVGPAGGITADAYFINANATVIVPSTLAPRNYQH